MAWQRKKGVKQTARHGGSPAPYTKRNKRPYKYSAKFYKWKEAFTEGRTALREKLNKESCLENGITIIYSSKGRPIYLKG